MNEASYTFTFEQDAKTVVQAMKAPTPSVFAKVQGQGWAGVIKLVQCSMIGFGAFGVSVLVHFLRTGQVGLDLWGLLLGLILTYVAVFGTLFVTLPVMARQALATRVNQGPVTLTANEEGLRTELPLFQSKVAWAGLDAVTRRKNTFIFWLGRNRISLPLRAFEDAGQIEAFEANVSAWMEASR